jgi:hypothetical protein
VKRWTASLTLTALALAAGCAAQPQKAATDQTVTDPARGVRYLVPAGWHFSDAEIRSPAGSLLTLRVYDLVEADKKFVAGLPDTLFPQLLEWAELYYRVEGPPVRTETTIAGLPATEMTYPIRVRPKDPPSKVIYWLVVRKTRLFVMRTAYPPNALAADEPIIRKVIAGWAFLETRGNDDQ